MNGIAFIDDNKKDIVIAWTVALFVHILFFSLTGKMFIEPPQFALAPTREIDINLIDMPKEVTQVQEEPKPVEKAIAKPKQLIPTKVLVKPRRVITSSGQVKVEAKPVYIQNPPPPYPELARQMHQEGIVMLSVDVNKEGDPVSVGIIQSSGFHMLDQAALNAVRHWKFQPGRVGDLSVESMVNIPIRFKLNS